MVGPTAQSLVRHLTSSGQTVATAESLTGGLVGAAFTDVPGASACFRGGVIAYATELKHELLGVDEGLVVEHGVVSEPCAAAMAAGVRALLGVTWGVSTTGVAGPETQEGHPPGTVFVAVSGPPAGGGLTSWVRRLSLEGDRGEIRAAAGEAALRLLAEALDSRKHGTSPRG